MVETTGPLMTWTWCINLMNTIGLVLLNLSTDMAYLRILIKVFTVGMNR